MFYQNQLINVLRNQLQVTALLNKVAVVKLNGGLGTRMGLSFVSL